MTGVIEKKAEHEEDQYLTLVRDLLDHGERRFDR